MNTPSIKHARSSLKTINLLDLPPCEVPSYDSLELDNREHGQILRPLLVNLIFLSSLLLGSALTAEVSIFVCDLFVSAAGSAHFQLPFKVM